MPKPGYEVLTISTETGVLLEKLRRKTGAKSKHAVIQALVKGVLN